MSVAIEKVMICVGYRVRCVKCQRCGPTEKTWDDALAGAVDDGWEMDSSSHGTSSQDTCPRCHEALEKGREEKAKRQGGYTWG